MRTFIYLLVLLSGAAIAGVNVTREPQRWTLADDQSVPIKDAKGAVIRTDSAEQCELEAVKVFGVAAVAARKFRCINVVVLNVTAICDASNTKAEPPPVADDDGYFVRKGKPDDPEPQLCPSGDSFRISRQVWVVKPPVCGEYKPQVWQACGTEVPEVAFEDPDTNSDGVTDEQSPWIAGVDYPYSQPCPVEALGGCFIPSMVATRECPDEEAAVCNVSPRMP